MTNRNRQRPGGGARKRSGAGGASVGAASRVGDAGAASRRPRSAADAPDVPVAKNEEYVAEIVGLGHDGEGVGRVNGFTLFVQGALPGEKVRVKVLKVKKQYGYAKLLDIVQPSPDRIDAPCPIYKQCGGCQLQHMSYDAQLRWKRQLVVDNLERIGKLRVADGGTAVGGSGGTSEGASDGARDGTAARGEAVAADGERVAGAANSVRGAGYKGQGGEPLAASERSGQAGVDDAYRGIVVRPTLGMSDPWRYRNKAQVPVGHGGPDMEGGLVAGFYAQGSHRIIDMDACLIQHEQNDEVVRVVKKLAGELGIRAYDEATGRGLLRHVIARYGFHTGEIMVVLVTNGESIPHRDELIGMIREELPRVTSICQNVNTKATNVIFGDRTNVLWGRDVIYDTIGDVRFAISARSFYQVNPVQTEVLYGKALDFAELTGEETVIDAYCGIGTISLFLAQRARKVYGVEIVPEAIEDAKSNAVLNGIRNVDFAVGAAEAIIPAWREQGIAPDVIVVDPPRKGCDTALLETIIAMQPKRVVYVSCNPSTLARDLRVLEDGGFWTVEVQPVDMFPWTVHVETVAVMEICK
ncbi:23S rRNA (uracil(1939)-C(5))-methyltransferase RlmD [Paenibacillus sp. YYML68]|uniref:23S rRNA (uracil(1939)-C(5))-methyltransferase RlmD n=1 Tax=Paenibacillus sp. YYML68 TaxID=2909250 RepID=UPI0024927458|nr:23S rRNA (uracil(1939)-C(5))-methyltransferase RlmD [Paenibacillus sp. YYML68]